MKEFKFYGDLVAILIFNRPIRRFRLKVVDHTFCSFHMFNANLVEILLAAILVSSTYDRDQPVIKWGGIVLAVASVVSALWG